MDGASLPRDLHVLLAEREWLRGLARALASGGADAEDLEQETWVAALRSPPRKPGPVRGWLATVLRRKALDFRRSAGRRAAREEAAARPEAVPAAAEAVARAETRRRVLDAVLALEEPYRSTVILRYFEGLPPREIAARAAVPVETVRTRLRRALETLRERLDEAHGGRREAWAVALLEAAEPAAEDPGEDGAGAHPVSRTARTARIVVPAAAALLLAAGAAWLLPRDRPQDSAAAPPGTPIAAAAPAAGDAPGDGAAGPAARNGPAKAPDAPSPSPAEARNPAAPAPAGAGLVLRTRVEPEAPRFQEKVTLVATFENTGKEPVTIFLPDMAGWVVPFPAWRLRNAGGDRLHLAEGPWPQSRWEAGPIGEIVRLAPGESRSVETPVHGLLPEGGDPKAAPLPLGTGSYVVECTYANDTRKVPWTEKFGDRGVTREVEGLWTGSIAAEPFEMRVLPGDVPALRLNVVRDASAERPGLLGITVENTSTRPLELRGRLLLREVVKGIRGLEASLLPGDPCSEAAPGETAVLRVEPEAVLRLLVDLARLSGDWLERRYPMLQVEFEPEGDGPGLSSRTIHLNTPPLPSVEERGLRLKVSPLPGPGLSVLLRNDGEKSLLVPRDFAWPSRLHVEVRCPAGAEGEGWITVDEAGGKSRLTARVIGWDVAGKPRPLAAGDFADLVPGGTMAVELPLVSDALPRFPPGEYEVRVSWRNVEGGVRAGLEQGSVLVGTLWSSPIRVEMPAR